MTWNSRIPASRNATVDSRPPGWEATQTPMAPNKTVSTTGHTATSNHRWGLRRST
jgi:hypothetical protein